MDESPAERARTVRREPHVDAFNVEAVIARGQDPDFLAVD